MTGWWTVFADDNPLAAIVFLWVALMIALVCGMWACQGVATWIRRRRIKQALKSAGRLVELSEYRG